MYNWPTVERERVEAPPTPDTPPSPTSPLSPQQLSVYHDPSMYNWPTVERERVERVPTVTLAPTPKKCASRARIYTDLQVGPLEVHFAACLLRLVGLTIRGCGYIQEFWAVTGGGYSKIIVSFLRRCTKHTSRTRTSKTNA